MDAEWMLFTAEQDDVLNMSVITQQRQVTVACCITATGPSAELKAQTDDKCLHKLDMLGLFHIEMLPYKVFS